MRRFLVLAVLLPVACTGPGAPQGQPLPATEAEPAPSEPIGVEAAEAPAGPASVDLAAYREAARGEPSPERACRLLAEGEALIVGLTAELGEAFSAAATPEAEPEAFEAFEAEVSALSASLPGLRLEVIGHNALHVAFDYRELTGLAGEAGVPILDAADGLLGPRFPPWLEQTWDYGGCGRPAGAGPALDALARVWPEAPDCLKAALGPAARARIGGLGDLRCFCADRETVEAEIDAIAPSLEALEPHGGPAALSDLRGRLAAATFEDLCTD